MAKVTDLGFTLDELTAALEAGDVRVQYHPEFPELAIFNYTEDVQFRNRWNKITLACRGLILDITTGDVVARPWEKFFNFGQMDNRIDSDAPVEVTDKMDGSLGILYWDGRDMAIATRGSFASDQALHATALVREKYREFLNFMILEPYADEYTLLFEIIYPENRIVCNYGDMDDLVLLGAVDKNRGYYIGPEQAAGMFLWNGPVTQVWHYDKFTDALSAPDRKGAEGYVIRSGRNIVKLKQADYVELHRIVTNLSPKTIWEMIGAGKTIGDICNDIPDEFHKYVQDIGDKLIQDASDLTYLVNSIYADIYGKFSAMHRWTGSDPTRRQWAEAINKYPDYKKYLFLLLDGKDIQPVVWQNLKPRGDVKSLIKDDE